MRDDPLEDRRALRARCKCEGHGWIWVPDGYADRMIRLRPFMADRRRALEASVFPCPTHRPELYERWAGGHLDPDHDGFDCEICQAVDPKARGRYRRPLELVGAGDVPRASLPYKDDE